MEAVSLIQGLYPLVYRLISGPHSLARRQVEIPMSSTGLVKISVCPIPKLVEFTKQFVMTIKNNNGRGANTFVEPGS
jgi:hypothetical protein